MCIYNCEETTDLKKKLKINSPAHTVQQYVLVTPNNLGF